MIRGWSWRQWALRAVAAASPQLALLVMVVADGDVGVTIPVLVVLCSTGAALAADSAAGLAALALVLAWWCIRVPDPLSPWVLAVGPLLLLAHLALVVAEHGPGTMEVDGPLVRLWLWRGALVGLAVPATWAVARLVEGQPDAPYVWAVATSACVVGVVLVLVRLRLGPPAGNDTHASDLPAALAGGGGAG